MIPMQRQATTRAVVPANRQVFLNRSATDALLACAPGIDFHEGDTGFGGVVAQRQQEAGPAGVADRPAAPGTSLGDDPAVR